MTFLIIVLLIIAGIVAYVIFYKKKPDILSELRSKIPVKVDSVKKPSMAAAMTFDEIKGLTPVEDESDKLRKSV